MELSYLPSASRWVDWYATVGYERWKLEGETVREWRDVIEPEVKFRWKKWVFAGLKLGVRSRDLVELNDSRPTVEFGGGAW